MTTTQVATMTARAYAIDKAHSEVTFQVRHLLTKVRGRFSDFAGTVRFDEQQPEHSSVSLTIDATTVDTNNAPQFVDRALGRLTTRRQDAHLVAFANLAPR